MITESPKESKGEKADLNKDNWHAVPVKKLLCLFLLGYGTLLYYFVLHSPFSFFEVDGIHPIINSEIIASDAVSTEELPESGWQKQRLPDEWMQSVIPIMCVK